MKAVSLLNSDSGHKVYQLTKIWAQQNNPVKIGLNALNFDRRLRDFK